MASHGRADVPFRLYCNLLPESLVASNLDPAAYAAYLAVGAEGRSRGQALFFEVDPAGVPADFPMEEARARCHPGANGVPKHSVYLGIYRVIERLPLEALGRLCLVTDDGRMLALERGAVPPDAEGLHYYQEFAPIKPRVLSRLGPSAFTRHLCTPGKAVSLPKVVFAELRLPEEDAGDAGNLPYAEMVHLQDCMRRMREDPGKLTKMITRIFGSEVIYRTVLNGFFAGDATDIAYYPMPSSRELEGRHYDWWRSAQTLHMD